MRLPYRLNVRRAFQHASRSAFFPVDANTTSHDAFFAPSSGPPSNSAVKTWSRSPEAPYVSQSFLNHSDEHCFPDGVHFSFAHASTTLSFSSASKAAGA